MEVTVRGKHFEVPADIEDRARTKLGKLDHYLPALRDAMVEADVWHEPTKEPDQRYVVRAAVSGNGVHLRAEERASRLETAVDQAAHVLARQAQRHKERLYGRARNQASKASAETEGVAVADDREEGTLDKIAEVRHVSVKPMTVDEAVEQMGLTSEDHFLFLEDDGRQFALLQRRQDGDYTLIIPELS
ncbi:MAG: ribosome-associated translation inhibitor RaiA [Dehalococcoidia bacterium]